jgi:hypothetical protein
MAWQCQCEARRLADTCLAARPKSWEAVFHRQNRSQQPLSGVTMVFATAAHNYFAAGGTLFRWIEHP